MKSSGTGRQGGGAAASLARRRNYPYAIKVIKAITRGVKRLSKNASSLRIVRSVDIRTHQTEKEEAKRGGTFFVLFCALCVCYYAHFSKKSCNRVDFEATFTFFNL